MTDPRTIEELKTELKDVEQELKMALWDYEEQESDEPGSGDVSEIQDLVKEKKSLIGKILRRSNKLEK